MSNPASEPTFFCDVSNSRRFSTTKSEENFYKLKFAMKEIAEFSCNKEILPNDERTLLIIGLLAPNLGEFLKLVGEKIQETSTIISEK